MPSVDCRWIAVNVNDDVRGLTLKSDGQQSTPAHRREPHLKLYVTPRAYRGLKTSVRRPSHGSFRIPRHHAPGATALSDAATAPSPKGNRVKKIPKVVRLHGQVIREHRSYGPRDRFPRSGTVTASEVARSTLSGTNVSDSAPAFIPA